MIKPQFMEEPSGAFFLGLLGGVGVFCSLMIKNTLLVALVACRHILTIGEKKEIIKNLLSQKIELSSRLLLLFYVLWLILLFSLCFVDASICL